MIVTNARKNLFLDEVSNGVFSVGCIKAFHKDSIRGGIIGTYTHKIEVTSWNREEILNYVLIKNNKQRNLAMRNFIISLIYFIFSQTVIEKR